MATPDTHDSAASDGRAAAQLARWQRLLLPFMTGFVAALAAAFFVFSAVHLYRVTGFIEAEHGPNIRQLVGTELMRATRDAADREVPPPDAFQRSLLLLEADTLDKRYHQASALLMSRIWSRQLAFITGMVMAFLGAVFILGKISESTSNISGEGAGWKVVIASASPGIVLSTFGTVIVIASMAVQARLEVADAPVYVGTAHVGAPVPADAPAPPPLSLDEFMRSGAPPPAPPVVPGTDEAATHETPAKPRPQTKTEQAP